jgi:hypothetical protein
LMSAADGNGRVVLLLAIPASLLLLAGVLAFTAYAEDRLVSSRALILRVASHRSVRPEVAEHVVARELDRLLARTGTGL